MKITLDIKDAKAASFLNFIKSLDFVSVESADTEDIELTDEIKILLDQRRANHLNGSSKSLSWEEVKNDILKQ